ncbi:MAG TPA: Hsp20/alpha crystallin family protein [Terriglobales bacterium]|nr:Hsp20/alpha crystallin family protein [Terriglobales bacterium]
MNFQPSLFVQENEQGLDLQVDLPGVAREDLDIKVENDTVVLRAERKQRPTAKYARAFVLPDYIDQAGIQAKIVDGVLNLTLPRKEAAKPKTIPITVN